MDCGKLIEALRCETSNGGECWEKKCQYLVCGSYAYCNEKRIMTDAADAIERLQYQLEKYHERVVYLEEKCKELPGWKVTIH